MENRVYNNLLEQYNNLSIEERRAILIYKSPLGNLMNAISGVPNYMNLDGVDIANIIGNYTDEVDRFKHILFNRDNDMIRYAIFSDINFDNYYKLINSLRDKYLIIRNAINKISLKEDMTVYRDVSIHDSKALPFGNIISTTINKKDTNMFLFNDTINMFYTINLKKGTNVLVSPISLVYVYEDIDDDIEKIRPSSIKVINRMNSGLDEVILFRDYIDVLSVDYDDSDFNYVSTFIDTRPINREGERDMDNNNYTEVASMLEKAINDKKLGDLTIVEAFNCIKILRDDNAPIEARESALKLGNNLLSSIKSDIKIR